MCKDVSRLMICPLISELTTSGGEGLGDGDGTLSRFRAQCGKVPQSVSDSVVSPAEDFLRFLLVAHSSSCIICIFGVRCKDSDSTSGTEIKVPFLKP